eukprot:SAG31_NODE_2938_length_4883_cov_21.311521_4_plen_90_part_00
MGMWQTHTDRHLSRQRRVAIRYQVLVRRWVAGSSTDLCFLQQQIAIDTQSYCLVAQEHRYKSCIYLLSQLKRISMQTQATFTQELVTML